MESIFFNEDVLEAEKKIISSLQIPAILLMENAGANAARYILKFSKSFGNEIIILTGKGNNAGDGFVTARHLIAGHAKVKILTLYPEKDLSDLAKINYNILKNIESPDVTIHYIKDAKALRKETPPASLIIDAIFGVGFKGKLDNRIKDIIEEVNNISGKFVFSLDIPSGLYNYNQNTISVKADVTLAMGVKKFHSLFYKGKETSGKSKIINIGVSSSEFLEFNKKEIFETQKNDVLSMLPVRKINSNKYTNGKVFVLAGSRGLTGAAYLCSQAAMKAGSGAVVIGVPESISSVMACKLTEVMTLPLSETEEHSLALKSYDGMASRLEWADTVLIGPGISKNPETLELVRKIVKENNKNYVIDADALSAFKDNLKLLKNKNIILTPHIGEFSNLINKNIEDVRNNFYELAVNFAKEHKVVLLLKNSPTITVNENSCYINSTGKQNLATAGTGDVLSGIISGICAQTKNIMTSAIAGVYIHGKCGDNLFKHTGPASTQAGQLLSEIPFTLITLRQA